MERSTNQNQQEEELRTSGFSDEEIVRLLSIKRRFESGAYQETTSEAKRLEFVKWLYEQGKLES